MSNNYVAQLADMLSYHKEILKEFPFMYVSDAIGEEYKEWRNGDFVFIDIKALRLIQFNYSHNRFAALGVS